MTNFITSTIDDQMVGLARDLFLDRPDLRKEPAGKTAFILMEKHTEEGIQRGLAPEAFYKQCLEAVNVMIRIHELLARNGKLTSEQ